MCKLEKHEWKCKLAQKSSTAQTTATPAITSMMSYTSRNAKCGTNCEHSTFPFLQCFLNTKIFLWLQIRVFKAAHK